MMLLPQYHFTVQYPYRNLVLQYIATAILHYLLYYIFILNILHECYWI